MFTIKNTYLFFVIKKKKKETISSCQSFAIVVVIVWIVLKMFENLLFFFFFLIKKKQTTTRTTKIWENNNYKKKKKLKHTRIKWYVCATFYLFYYKMLRKIRHMYSSAILLFLLWLLYWMEVQFGHKSFGSLFWIFRILFSFYNFEKLF